MGKKLSVVVGFLALGFMFFAGNAFAQECDLFEEFS